MNPPVLHVVAPTVVGAALGAVVGYFGRCASGACPLTSSWWRGALYGGFLGLVTALTGRTA
jgi:hypothetical protein